MADGETEKVQKITSGDISKRLEKVIDPEMGLDIVTLGLIYRISVGDDGIEVDYTLTSPACPLAEYLAVGIDASLKGLGKPVMIDLVWDPVWCPEMMNEEGRLELGYSI